MTIRNIIPINLHKDINTSVPHFVVVDEGMRDELLAYRWLTAGSLRVVRSCYDREKGTSVPQTLARYVWMKSRVTPPPKLIAHVNGDLLDCRNDNLVGIPYPSLARSSNTGSMLKLFCEANSIVTDAQLRQMLGAPLEAQPILRGRKSCVSDDQVRQLLDARLTVASNISLKEFNAEVCAEVCGAPLKPALLSRILSGKVAKLRGYDYKKNQAVPPELISP